MPAIAKILIVFASMLALARVRVPLGLALAAGGIALDLWAGTPAADILPHLGRALVSGELWLLLAITALIIELGRFVTEGENATEIIAATRRWGGRHGSAASLMALPAVIGLIPMPAGALFSAPFVERIGAVVDGRAEWKAAVNYWFRHVWEYWWPLYPGVIVAMSIFEMDAWRFILVQFPFSLVAIVSGYRFLVRPHVSALRDACSTEEGSNRRAFRVLLPLVVVIASLFFLPPLLVRLYPSVGLQTRKLVSVLLGLLLALALVLAERISVAGVRKGLSRQFSAPLNRKSVGVLFALGGVLVFKYLLGCSGLLPIASRELVESGLPLSLAVATLPFLAGLVTGIALGFTGVSFPLVVGLMAAEGSGLTPAATLVLAYGFGYMGMMVSPIHLCMVVTREYFTAGAWSFYKRLLPSVGVVMVFSVAAYLLLHALGW